MMKLGLLATTCAMRRHTATLVRSPTVARAFTTGASPSSGSSYNAAAAARTLKLLERRKVTTLDIGILKRKSKPITMVTAYDYPSAVHVDLAGFDILLVGDSVGMVELVSGAGYHRWPTWRDDTERDLIGL
jgi:hypothetical protein